MSKFIENLIGDLVVNDMATIKKMKKADLLQMTEALLKDNYRELHDDSIVEIYEELFTTNLARV